MLRDLSLRTTPGEQQQLDEVYDHATQRNVRLVSRHKVRIVVRCNQPGSKLSSGMPCGFMKEVETVAVEATDRGRAIFAQHLMLEHRSLDTIQRNRLIAAMWFNLKDV